MKPSSTLSRCCVAALVLLLTACSATNFVYNRLDFLVPWYVDDYVELNRDQDRYLEEMLQPFLEWHRRQELPLYLVLLNRIEANLDREITRQDVDTIAVELEAASERLQYGALDWMLKLAEDLSDAQIAELIAQLRTRQLKYEDEQLGRSEEKYRKEAYKNLLDNLQDFLGRLPQDSRDQLEATANALVRTDAAFLAEREQWLDRLEQLLRREPGWQQRLREAVAQRNELWSPQYQQMYTHNLKLIRSVTLELINERSERQDRHLRRELGKLREDLQSLIQQGLARSQQVTYSSNDKSRTAPLSALVTIFA